MASSLIPSSVPEPEFSQWNADNQSSSSNSPSDSDLSKTPHAELSSDSVIYSGNPASTGQPTPEIIPDDATSSSTNYCGNDQKNAKSADQSDPQLSTSSTKRKRRGMACYRMIFFFLTHHISLSKFNFVKLNLGETLSCCYCFMYTKKINYSFFIYPPIGRVVYSKGLNHYFGTELETS